MPACDLPDRAAPHPWGRMSSTKLRPATDLVMGASPRPRYGADDLTELLPGGFLLA
jgi:hypothetical protein